MTAEPQGSTRPPARPARPPRPPRRRRIPIALAVAFVFVALVGGVVLGYSVRGEPAPAGLITEDRDVPVVTLTVEAP